MPVIPSPQDTTAQYKVWCGAGAQGVTLPGLHSLLDVQLWALYAFIDKQKQGRLGSKLSKAMTNAGCGVVDEQGWAAARDILGQLVGDLCQANLRWKVLDTDVQGRFVGPDRTQE